MEKLCKQLEDTNCNNYQEIPSFELEKDDFELALSKCYSRIEQLEEEEEAALRESKWNADLLKEVKRPMI